MNFTITEFYWLENKRHGTLRGRLSVVSTNQKSLLFRLPMPVALHVDGGIAVTDQLALLQTTHGNTYRDFAGEEWTVSEKEPAVKIPTK